MESSNRMKEQLTLDPAKPISEQKVKPKQSLFRSILQKLYPERPASLPSAQALESFKFDELDFNTLKGKKMLYTILRRNPLVFRSIFLRSAFAIPSIRFEFNNDQEKNVVELFLKNLHPASGKLQLETSLRDLYMDVGGFGTGFLDPIWNKEKTMIVGLKKIHPISMDLQRDDGFGEGGKVKLDSKGNPVGWIQKIDDTKTKELTFEQIAYLTFTTFGDEWLGISELEPLYQTVWRLMNIEEGIATAIYRHGFPLWDVTVSGGTDGRPPTKPQLENAAEEVKGLNYKSEFIHPPNYKVDLKESFSMSASKDYTEPFVDQIAALSGIPKFILLGSAIDVTKASFPELLKTIRLSLEPSRKKMRLFFEEQILRPLMEANHIDTTPRLIINEVSLLEVGIKEGEVAEKKKEEKVEEDIESLEEKVFEKIMKKLNEKKLEETKKEETNDALPKERKTNQLKGLNLNTPHGKNLLSGEKKQLAFSIKQEKEMKKFLGKETELYENTKLIGKIKLREPRKVGLNEFIDLEYAHMVEGEERELRWPKETDFLVYEFDIIKEGKK